MMTFTPIGQSQRNKETGEPDDTTSITSGSEEGQEKRPAMDLARGLSSGLIDSFSGRFFYKAQAGRFSSASYAAFLLDVLSQTTQHVVVIQDGARYHTSKAMQAFFETHADRLTISHCPPIRRTSTRLS